MAKQLSHSTPTFAQGGKTKMFGEQEAGPQKPGVSGHDVPSGETQWASGGKTKMHPYTPSVPAKPGCSSPY